LLIHRQQVNQSYLVEHITVFTLPHLQTPGARGMSLAQQFTMGDKHGMMMLYGMVQKQAMMLSFNDIYRILCVMMFLLVPTFLFLKRDTRNLPASEAAH
jgi:hypothetical protein